MKRIAIEVNGVLRDTIGKLKQVYEKFLIEKSEDVSDHQFIINSETEDVVEIIEEDDFVYEIIEPVETLEIAKYFKFKSKEEQFSFIYEEFPMNIFGHAPSSEMLTFNYFNDFYKEFRDEYEIVIISDEVEKSKPSTLFFLSKFSCLAENIIFYNSTTIDKVISSFDLIVTSNPDIIINYSNILNVIKYETEYNKQVSTAHEIKSLEELTETLKKIKNVKIIQ
jgi:hypothetical protein